MGRHVSLIHAKERCFFKVFLFTFMITFGLLHFHRIFINSACGYNTGSNPSANEVHQWITEKAVDLVLKKENGIAKRFPLGSYLNWLKFGVWFADHSNTNCTWSIPLIGQVTADCDSIHHYSFAHQGTIQTCLPGACPLVIAEIGRKEVTDNSDTYYQYFSAELYADKLYEQALKFWPGGEKPSLSTLEKIDAGEIRLFQSTTDLMDTYIGGWPLCELYFYNMYNDEQAAKAICPKWPSWTYGEEGVEAAMRYLGWALHMIQDLTVPYHKSNLATADHQTWEDDVSTTVIRGDFNHLPGNYNYCRDQQNCTLLRTYCEDPTDQTTCKSIDILAEIDTLAEMDNVKNFALYTVGVATTMVADRFPQHATESKELLLDLAIRASAALIEKFFKNIALDEDEYEDNDSKDNASDLSLHKLNIVGGGHVYKGNYSGLTIYPHDPDCYKITVPENFMDLFIDIRYGIITGTESVLASLYKGDETLQGSQTNIPDGKHIEVGGLLENDYVFVCLNSEKNYPFNYDVDITLVPNIYLQNNPRIDVAPYSIYFSSKNDRVELTIYNRGGADLRISNMSTELELDSVGPLFVVDLNAGSNPCGLLPKTIQSLQSCTIVIGVNQAFNEPLTCDYNDMLTISSNDTTQENTYVDLSLSCKPPFIPGDFQPYLPVIKPDLPYIFVPETGIDFGDVLVDRELTLAVNIFNLGGKDLVISNIYIQGVSESKSESPFNYKMYDLDSKGVDLTVPPGGVVTINVTFNPREVGPQSANLIIESNDDEHGQIIIPLSARGIVIIPGDFDHDMDVDQNDLKIAVNLFDQAVNNGTLVGLGPGKSANKRLKALRNMFVAAGKLIETGDTSRACRQLMDAYKKIDGKPNPPDFVTGDAASGIAAMIQQMIETLCK